jgi:hypothetical protein
MVLLEDPPPGMADRWQAGAELCAEHGIPTSRMSVWRFYRAHILEWRREHAPPLAPVPEESTSQLLDRARHLVALRALESLHDPHLPPLVLVGLVQNENRRQELQLARDKFDNQLEIRRQLEDREHFQAIDDEARDRALYPLQLKSYRHYFETLIKSSVAAREARENPPEPGLSHTAS